MCNLIDINFKALYIMQKRGLINADNTRLTPVNNMKGGQINLKNVKKTFWLSELNDSRFRFTKPYDGSEEKEVDVNSLKIMGELMLLQTGKTKIDTDSIWSCFATDGFNFYRLKDL